MTHSALINRTIPHHGKYSERNGARVARLLQHHLAGLGPAADNDLERADVQKSVHYIIYSDGELVGQVPEEFRAWTSGSAAADDPSITVEIENISGAFNGDDNHPDAWKISQLAFNTLVKLLADVAQRHNFQDINDTTYMGHRQVFATACPGGFIWNRMGQIRENAKTFRSSGQLSAIGPAKGLDDGNPIKNNMIELGDFEKLVLNQYINVDNSFGAQCWDLFARFTDWLKLPRVNTFGGQYHGWAGAIWDQYGKNGAEKDWNRIGPDQVSLQGDVPIWGPTAGIYPATHIALTVEDAGDSLWCFSQNSSPSRPDNPYPQHSTGPTILQKLPKTGLLGYLRHKKVTAKGALAAPLVKSDAQLADEVLAGKWGDGDQRIARLGNRYQGVQNEINRRFGAPQVVNISQLADQVLAGQFGDGDERIARLGANYAAVQAEINRRFSVPQPQAKSIAQLANETLAGMYCDGDERIRRLGVNYNAVQNEINRRYGAPATVQPKSIAQLADEVLAGKHGDGDARVRSLGGSYQAVQNEINRRFGG